LRDHWRKPQALPLEEVPESKMGITETDSDSHMLLDQVLELMSPRERQLTWLAYAEGLTHQQIADVTGLGATSIRILLFRAKRKLARLLRQRKSTNAGTSS
jgi:RNA polymerase sigma-70 factor (ECF subfamily)